MSRKSATIQGFMSLRRISLRKDEGQVKSSFLRKKAYSIISHVHPHLNIIETGCNPDKGLTDSLVAKNQERFGSNTYKKKKTKSFFEILL